MPQPLTYPLYSMRALGSGESHRFGKTFLGGGFDGPLNPGPSARSLEATSTQPQATEPKLTNNPAERIPYRLEDKVSPTPSALLLGFPLSLLKKPFFRPSQPFPLTPPIFSSTAALQAHNILTNASTRKVLNAMASTSYYASKQGEEVEDKNDEDKNEDVVRTWHSRCPALRRPTILNNSNTARYARSRNALRSQRFRHAD